MAKFNLPKPAIFKPTKSLHSAGGFGGGGDVTNNITNNTYYTGDPFGYSSTTNPSGIGIAEVRFNSTTFGSITKMYVSDNDQNSVDLVAEQSIMTSGVAKLYKADGGKLSFQVTRMVDQSGYFEYDVAPLSGTMPTVGEVCYVDFVPDAPGVRVWNAIISQTGTGDPSLVGSVTKDSLVGAVTLHRLDVGVCRVNGSSIFAGVAFAPVQMSSSGAIVRFTQSDDSAVLIESFSLVTGLPVEIEGTVPVDIELFPNP